MSVFTDEELDYLAAEPGLARVATVGPDGTPHVVPSGWTLERDRDTILLGGRALERTKKYRDAQRSGRVALVVDDVLPPWQPRGIEIRGRAEALTGPEAAIRVHPERVVSWGLHGERLGEHHARTVG